MINLITGLPGACKTLFTIAYVRDLSKRDNRPVFYSGIPQLDAAALGWTEIDAEKWFTAPPGSIVIIDECQRVFRPRSISKDVPEFVSKLETHRHDGIDLFLITQHPMLADSAIRRLTGNHRHIVRRFGMESSTIHQWDVVKDQPEKPATRLDSNKTVWSFDKSVYGLYKSAEVHTVKRSIPKRLFLVFMIPVALVIAGWYVYHFQHVQSHPELKTNPVNSSGSALGSQPSNLEKFDYKNAVDDAKEFVYKETPRVADFPHTAPKYDKLTEATVAPFPVGCVKTEHSCSCFSQQATPVKTSQATCERIVDQGIFEDFDVNGKERLADSTASQFDQPPVPSLPEKIQDQTVLSTVSVSDASPVVDSTRPPVRLVPIKRR